MITQTILILNLLIEVTPIFNNEISVCWKAIVNGSYIKNDRFWTFENNVKWIGDIEIYYNREIYDKYIELLKLNDYPNFTTKTLCLIYGTQGIGKSLFLLALLITIVENAKNKNICIPSIHYVRKFGKEEQIWSLLSNGNIVLWNKVTYPEYLLSDNCDITVPYGSILNLEVAYNNQNQNYNNFRKRIKEGNKKGFSFYRIMPLFTFKELNAIKIPIISKNCALFLWLVFGGNARNFDDFSVTSYYAETVETAYVNPIIQNAMELYFKNTNYQKNIH